MEITKIPADDILTEKVWGGVFFHPLFVDTAREIFNLAGESLFIEKGGDPVCAVNLLVRNHSIARSAAIPLLFQYYGVIFFQKDLRPEVMRRIEAHIAEKCDYAMFSFPPDFHHEALSGGGWELGKQITLALRNDDLHAWGRDFRDDVKNKIRKARKESVQIEEVDAAPDDLWARAYQRRRLVPPVAPSILRQWCQRLSAGSLLKIFVAKIDGSPVAFRGELIHGDFAYDWIAGSSPEFHATGSNQLLMAEIGSRLIETGIRTWDLVGGSVKSIRDFKKSFGAQDYIHYHGKICFNLKGKLFSILRKIKYGLQS